MNPEAINLTMEAARMHMRCAAVSCGARIDEETGPTGTQKIPIVTTRSRARRLRDWLPWMAIFGAVMLVLAGCGSSDPDKALYQAVAPKYARYVASDKAIDESERLRRFRTIYAWSMDVDEPLPAPVSATALGE